ncbi:MAG: spore germination protein [Clostridiaceae bacterium]
MNKINEDNFNENYVNKIKERLKDNVDLKCREINLRKGTVYLFFIDNLCDSKFISEYIIEPILNHENDENLVESFVNNIVYANSIGSVKDFNDALVHILSGDVVIVPTFSESIVFCEAKGYSKRSITVPITEGVLKGPREGFNEAFVDNISLIRRKIKNPDLKFENFTLGRKSKTVVVVAYISGLTNNSLIEYVKNKIKNLKVDYILDTNYIEEKLRYKNTLFDTIGFSEKPDIVAARLLQGRVAVIVDGTPFVITAPYFFIENFQTADDYYLNKYVANATRIIRFVSFSLAVILPALYIALTTFHYQLIPSIVVFRLAVSRAGVPFPTIAEVVLMVFFFQLLREAGVRLPQPIGQAMSIVGALILGDAAVSAGLTSETTIIVVAVASISSFLVPRLYGVIFYWNMFLLVMASLLGLVGLYIGFLILIAHVGNLESCDYPYLFPLGTKKTLKYKDILKREEIDKVSKSEILKEDKK